MLFNSITFVVFFGIVLLLHNLPLSWRVRKFNLLWLSYVFYGAWNPPFVAILWLSTAVDWYASKGIHRATSTSARRWLLLLSLATNLGLLCFFKYGGFIVHNFELVITAAGFEWRPPEPNIILPVGISFYTFQTMSYTIDIYRRKAQPWHSFLDYALYVTFFPQLVAGPIVRSNDFLPQCVKAVRTTAAQFGWGLTLLTVGLFEKVVIADSLMAPVVELAYETKLQISFVAAWAGTFAFATQIFCDFAGYSTCAIGVAMCLGFALPDNFRFPYGSIGFSDFWRRWHISLSTWLRDYLYIPLGGNRHGLTRTQVNLLMTMLLGGLWHGASWTFVIWGGLHGTFLVIERILRWRFGQYSFWSTPIWKFILCIFTFLLVCITWVFFRSPTFGQSWELIAVMTGLGGSDFNPIPQFQVAVVVGLTAIIVLLHWVMRDRTIEDVANKTPRWIIVGVLVIMLLAILLTPGQDRAFIYFQF